MIVKIIMNQVIQINPTRKLTKRKSLECTCEFTNFRVSGKNLRYSTCDICSEHTVNNYLPIETHNTNQKQKPGPNEKRVSHQL